LPYKVRQFIKQVAHNGEQCTDYKDNDEQESEGQGFWGEPTRSWQKSSSNARRSDACVSVVAALAALCSSLVTRAASARASALCCRYASMSCTSYACCSSRTSCSYPLCSLSSHTLLMGFRRRLPTAQVTAGLQELEQVCPHQGPRGAVEAMDEGA
jgi:hypothetical protein